MAGGRFTFDGAGWSNQGLIDSLNGVTLDFNGTNWTNPGIIETDANASFVFLRGTFTNGGTIASANGIIKLTGTLDNRGRTLPLNDTNGSWYIQGGEILGGTVTTAGSAELIGAMNDGILAGVTIAGTLDLASTFFPGAHLTIQNGLTLDQGLIEINSTGYLNFQGTQVLGGTGTISLSGVSGNNGLLIPKTGDILTIGPGITVQGNSGVVGSSGGGLFTNQGTIEAESGGTLTAQGDTNSAGGTLTGGTWQAVGNSTLRVLGADIATIAASILLDGPSSHFFSDANTTNAPTDLATIAASGQLSLQNGFTLNTAGASAIRVRPSSALAAP